MKFKGDVNDFFSTMCNTTFETAEDFHNCINPLLYEENELIKDSFLYDFIWKNSTPYKIELEPFITTLGYGKCYVAKNIGVLGTSKMVKVTVNKTIDYKMWVHDPDYFLSSYFPYLTPGLDFIFRKQEVDNMGAWTYFEAEEYQLFNREKSPCTNYKEQSSSFTKCTIQEIIRRTKCKVRKETSI